MKTKNFIFETYGEDYHYNPIFGMVTQEEEDYLFEQMEKEHEKSLGWDDHIYACFLEEQAMELAINKEALKEEAIEKTIERIRTRLKA